MRLKPFRILDPVDEVNLFGLTTVQTGSMATPVTIHGSGFNPSAASTSIFGNLFPNIPNVYSPRHQVNSWVRPATSGEAPFGITLYDQVEVNQFNYSLLYDKQRKLERQAVLSGEAMPIARKGTFHVGPWASTDNPAPGKFVVVSTGTVGDWAISNTSTNSFGKFLGPKDSDGYAIVSIDCY